MITFSPDWLWPIQEKDDPTKLKNEQEKFNEDIAKITDAYWRNEQAVVLDEAHRLYDEEEERRRVADSKATTYLLVAAALIPVLTYFEGVIWGDKIGTAPRWLAFAILIFALMYVIGFGRWAFATMRLVGYHRIGATEIADLTTGRDVNHAPFIRRYLDCARRNQVINNCRLSSLKMAHEFLIRAFIMFGIVVLLESGFGIYDAFALHEKRGIPSCPPSVSTPDQNIPPPSDVPPDGWSASSLSV